MEIAKGQLDFEGRISMDVVRDGERIDTIKTRNIVLNQGLVLALNSTLQNQPQLSPWFVGLLANFSPSPETTMTQIAANEFTDYEETQRSIWNSSLSNTVASNVAERSLFTMSQNNLQIFGAFLTSSAVKAGTQGIAFAAGQFENPRIGLIAGDELFITYEMEARTA